MTKLLMVSTLTLFASLASAGNIRNIQMNSGKMRSINLKMGQSTIVRFSDKPKKVVVGNQNYYAVEFIGNDVTIQPLGLFDTNLFVYTDNHVYGFLLRTRNHGVYDDLVNVRWKAQGIVFKQRERQRPFLERKLSLEMFFKTLRVKIYRVIVNKERGTHIIDFTARNNSLKEAKTKDIKVFLTRNKKILPFQEMVFEKDEIRLGETIKGRVLVRLKEKNGFSFNVEYKKERRRKIISRRFL